MTLLRMRLPGEGLHSNAGRQRCLARAMIALLLLLLNGQQAAPEPTRAPLLAVAAQAFRSQVFRSQARAVARSLQERWLIRSSTGQIWHGVHAWQRFVIIDTLADYTRVSGDRTYLPQVEEAVMNRAGLDGNDDDLWAVLASLRVYRLSQAPELLRFSRDKFNELTTQYWDGTCGGGLWWDHARTYKNAITNELLLYAATELYAATGDAAYAGWAQKAWAWFRDSGLINADHLVNDGLDAQCRNNRQLTYTYNQGVILGGLSGLYRIDHDQSHLQAAASIARAAISRLSKNGVLTEAVPALNEDGQSFKGVFVFHLARLWQVSSDAQLRQVVSSFLAQNAHELWLHREKATDRMDAYWDGLTPRYGAAAQAAALALFDAAMETSAGAVSSK